ncbi:hypothetical protein T492DRAFT_1041461 [Pavlovales sp. CCMP2436]|nr:hypothetical protein T492DRAFT_1041461 [Pavlovales sp. CCMP2436]
MATSRALLLALLLCAATTCTMAFALSPKPIARSRALRAATGNPFVMVAFTLDAQNDWFSTTALVAEQLISQCNKEECNVEDLDQVVSALEVAERKHRKLRSQLSDQVTKLRLATSEWYLDLDH